MLDPALAEFPSLGDPLRDRSRPLPRGAEHAPQGIVDGIRQHRAERLVGACELVDLTAQCGEVRFGSTVDSTEIQLRAEIDQQLVAPRRRTVGDRLDRVQWLDLIDAHLGGQGDHRHGGVSGTERDVIGSGRTGGGHRHRRGRGNHFGRDIRDRCRRIRLGLRLRIGIGGE